MVVPLQKCFLWIYRRSGPIHTAAPRASIYMLQIPWEGNALPSYLASVAKARDGSPARYSWKRCADTQGHGRTQVWVRAQRAERRPDALQMP